MTTYRGLFLASAATLLALATGGAAVAQTPAAPPPPASAPRPLDGPPGGPAIGSVLGPVLGPQPVMILTPVAIERLQAGTIVAVKGSVAEIYGNKFILQDDSGRMLVELGPRGEGGDVVTKGEQVAVQGQFDRGFIVAQLVSHADGRNQAFGPPPPPPREADRGPGRGLPPAPPAPPAPR